MFEIGPREDLPFIDVGVKKEEEERIKQFFRKTYYLSQTSSKKTSSWNRINLNLETVEQAKNKILTYIAPYTVQYRIF